MTGLKKKQQTADYLHLGSGMSCIPDNKICPLDVVSIIHGVQNNSGDQRSRDQALFDPYVKASVTHGRLLPSSGRIRVAPRLGIWTV
jgi:hypothetical protein